LSFEFTGLAIGNKAFNRGDGRGKPQTSPSENGENPLNCFLCELGEFSAVKSLLGPENRPENSSLPGRFRGRKTTPSVVKLRISKDALSYWNFSYLWEICRHQEGLRKITGRSPFFVGKCKVV
jgi:hypothetical protein